MSETLVRPFVELVIQLIQRQGKIRTWETGVNGGLVCFLQFFTDLAVKPTDAKYQEMEGEDGSFFRYECYSPRWAMYVIDRWCIRRHRGGPARGAHYEVWVASYQPDVPNFEPINYQGFRQFLHRRNPAVESWLSERLTRAKQAPFNAQILGREGNLVRIGPPADPQSAQVCRAALKC